jgi:hypothetical protein
MRFLVLLILSTLFYIAPLQGNTEMVSEKHLQLKFEDISLHKEIVIENESDESFPLVKKTFLNRVSSARVLKPPFADQVSTTEWTYGANAILGRTHRMCPHFYCQPIGLKLLFPHNYFW